MWKASKVYEYTSWSYYNDSSYGREAKTVCEMYFPGDYTEEQVREKFLVKYRENLKEYAVACLITDLKVEGEDDFKEKLLNTMDISILKDYEAHLRSEVWKKAKELAAILGYKSPFHEGMTEEEARRKQEDIIAEFGNHRNEFYHSIHYREKINDELLESYIHYLECYSRANPYSDVYKAFYYSWSTLRMFFDDKDRYERWLDSELRGLQYELGSSDVNLIRIETEHLYVNEL